jgi:c-di-GMP-binding flagellar brake protein YcgR
MPFLDTSAARTTHSEVALQERRRYPRLKIGVPIEFKPEGADCMTRAQTSDISCGGCYIEMNFTLPAGTKLNFVLWLNNEKLATKAVVATHHPYFGNGIKFVDLSVEDLNRLNRFLTAGLR